MVFVIVGLDTRVHSLCIPWGCSSSGGVFEPEKSTVPPGDRLARLRVPQRRLCMLEADGDSTAPEGLDPDRLRSADLADRPVYAGPLIGGVLLLSWCRLSQASPSFHDRESLLVE